MHIIAFICFSCHYTMRKFYNAIYEPPFLPYGRERSSLSLPPFMPLWASWKLKIICDKWTCQIKFRTHLFDVDRRKIGLLQQFFANCKDRIAFWYFQNAVLRS